MPTPASAISVGDDRARALFIDEFIDTMSQAKIRASALQMVDLATELWPHHQGQSGREVALNELAEWPPHDD